MTVYNLVIRLLLEDVEDDEDDKTTSCLRGFFCFSFCFSITYPSNIALSSWNCRFFMIWSSVMPFSKKSAQSSSSRTNLSTTAEYFGKTLRPASTAHHNLQHFSTFKTRLHLFILQSNKPKSIIPGAHQTALYHRLHGVRRNACLTKYTQNVHYVKIGRHSVLPH